MHSAFVNMKIVPEQRESALREISKVEYVQQTRAAEGFYNGIASVDATSSNILRDVISWDIRRRDELRGTLTSILVGSYMPERFVQSRNPFCARVMADVKEGDEDSVADRLLSLPEPYIKDIYRSVGLYRLIIGVEAPDYSSCRNFVVRRIGLADKIRSTLTLMETDRYVDGVLQNSNISDAKSVANSIESIQNSQFS